MKFGATYGHSQSFTKIQKDPRRSTKFHKISQKFTKIYKLVLLNKNNRGNFIFFLHTLCSFGLPMTRVPGGSSPRIIVEIFWAWFVGLFGRFEGVSSNLDLRVAYDSVPEGLSLRIIAETPKAWLGGSFGHSEGVSSNLDLRLADDGATSGVVSGNHSRSFLGLIEGIVWKFWRCQLDYNIRRRPPTYPRHWRPGGPGWSWHRGHVRTNPRIVPKNFWL